MLFGNEPADLDMKLQENILPLVLSAKVVSMFSRHTTNATLLSNVLIFVFVIANFIISVFSNIVIQLSLIANQPVNKS